MRVVKIPLLTCFIKKKKKEKNETKQNEKRRSRVPTFDFFPLFLNSAGLIV